MNIFIGVLIPFLGTSLGSSMVFFLKDKMNEKVKIILEGLAAGVMEAALIWSLIIPALNFEHGNLVQNIILTIIGFMCGIVFLLNIDNIAYDLKNIFLKLIKSQKGKSNKDKWIYLSDKNKKIFEAITIHNIPEGMAIGVIFAGVILNQNNISITSAISLALGIAIQNFPEGAIISMPAKIDGNSKWKSFLLGVTSGIVEPIAACITLVITNFIVPILPYILAFAAGSMMYVIIAELIPDTQNSNNAKLSIIWFTIGFLLMMTLDVIL